MDKVDNLFPDTVDISNPDEQKETKVYSNLKNNVESYLYDADLVRQLKPMLLGPAKRTLEAVQTMMRYLQDRYGVHISMRESMGLLKNLRFDAMDNYDSQTEPGHKITDATKCGSEEM